METTTNNPMSLPELLMDDFVDAVNGTADIDPFEVLHGILGDVMDSVRLAMSEDFLIPRDSAKNVMAIVEDYIANNYGER